MPLDILDLPTIAQVLFHPRPEYEAVSDTNGGLTVRFPLPDGAILGGRLHPAGKNAPVLLYFHGNGEIASDYDDLAPVYRQIGLTLLVIDYRGYGISTGVPTAATLAADACAVHEQAPSVVAALGLAPSRWLVMGRSLGSAAALAVAAESRAGAVAAESRAGPALSGLVIESGFADTFALVARLGGRVPPGAAEARDGFGNLRRIAEVAVPTLILHGEEDRIIPFEDGRRLYAAAGAADKRLVAIPDAGHNDLMMVGAERYFMAIKALSLR